MMMVIRMVMAMMMVIRIVVMMITVIRMVMMVLITSVDGSSGTEEE